MLFMRLTLKKKIVQYEVFVNVLVDDNYKTYRLEASPDSQTKTQLTRTRLKTQKCPQRTTVKSR